jgi:hypothetical protein
MFVQWTREAVPERSNPGQAPSWRQAAKLRLGGALTGVPEIFQDSKSASVINHDLDISRFTLVQDFGRTPHCVCSCDQNIAAQ